MFSIQFIQNNLHAYLNSEYSHSKMMGNTQYFESVSVSLFIILTQNLKTGWYQPLSR